MADLMGFDANEVAPSAPREALPEGKYVAVITHSEMKANKANTGSYLELTFEVTEGPHAGRTVKARLNLHNPNSQAVQIARAELSAVCRAVGVLKPQDSTDLHGLPLVVHVKVVKRQDNGELSNEVAGYSRRESATTTAPAVANGTVNGAVAAASNHTTTTPPWKR